MAVAGIRRPLLLLIVLLQSPHSTAVHNLIAEGEFAYSFEENDNLLTHILDEDGRFAFVSESVTTKRAYEEHARGSRKVLEVDMEKYGGFVGELYGHDSEFYFGNQLASFEEERILELVVGAGGPNCIQSGGGYAHPYQICDGCMIQNALQCISDMRHNISGNVPSGCNMNDMFMDIQPACCARFSRDETIDPNPGARIRPKTSAYNDALLCLHNAGCHYKKGSWGDTYKPVPFDSGTKNLFCYGNGGWPDKNMVVEEDDPENINPETGEHDLSAHTGDEVHATLLSCHNIYKNLEAECLMHTTHTDCKSECDPIVHDGALPGPGDCECWQDKIDGMSVTEDCAARVGTYDPWQCKYQRDCIGTGVDGVPGQVLTPTERNFELYWGIPCNQIDVERALNGTTLSSCPADENGKQIPVPHYCEIGPGGVWEYDLEGRAIIPGINVPPGETKIEYVNCIPNINRCFPTQSGVGRLTTGFMVWLVTCTTLVVMTV